MRVALAGGKGGFKAGVGWVVRRVGQGIACFRCHCPRKRAIQYSRDRAVIRRRCGVLDTPLSRSMTAEFEQASLPVGQMPKAARLAQCQDVRPNT
ncbi:hypothetical protein XH96_27555 [Bradyrhizobium sp. CCBAU 51765]|nr:hypothetical protein XH96_27555 [Bradyrhizobium sp. CCBAU 51765]